MFEEKLEDIYGIFGHPQECRLFVYQYVINLLSGGKGMELALQSVDKMYETYLKATANKTMLWQEVLYHDNVK